MMSEPGSGEPTAPTDEQTFMLLSDSGGSKDTEIQSVI